MAVKLMVISSARSDWNMLRPVVKAAARVPGCEVALSIKRPFPDFPYEGRILFLPEMLASLVPGDDPADITSVAAAAMKLYSAHYANIAPDIVLIAGDRFEAMAAAFAATVHRIPVAHLHGGDHTAGSYDNQFRHAITKLAHLHFVANEEARERVVDLGEEHVFVTGNPALDELVAWRDATPLERDDHLLVVFHPETLSDDCGVVTAKTLGRALARSTRRIVGVSPTRDVGGEQVRRALVEELPGKVNSTWVDSMEPEQFWTEMATCAAMVGNSSAALIEAPVLRTPAVNVGDRQGGRVRAKNVIDVVPISGQPSIEQVIKQALALHGDRAVLDGVSPYGDGFATARIVKVLADLDSPKELLKKDW